MATSDSDAICDCDLAKTEEPKQTIKLISASQTLENYDTIKKESKKLIETKKSNVPPPKNQISEELKKKSVKPSSDKPSSVKPSSKKPEMIIKRNDKEYILINNLIYLEMDPEKLTINDRPIVYNIDIKIEKVQSN